jgi:hypothetical protein
MKTITSLLIVFIFLFSFSLSAQNADNNDIPKRSNELGIHAGSTTGLGLSFRHWSNRFGVQFTALPIKTSDTQFISGGLTGMYSFNNKKYHRFFLYLGNHILVLDESDYYGEPTNTEIRYNAGFGTGFEVGKNVRYNIMIGYGGYNLTDGNDYLLLPAIEMGLYFKL